MEGAAAHTDIEKRWESEKQEIIGESEARSNQESQPKLDKHGFPLRPQPTDSPLDPLNWNRWIKLLVLLQVSFLGFLGPFSQGAIESPVDRVWKNSAYRPLSQFMGITITEASYNTTLAIVLAGVAPLFYSPLANIYGRRPVYIFSCIIGIVAGARSAISTHWKNLLVARVFVGVGTSAGMGIGASVVSDMYFMHERGKYMGIYVIFTTNGAHIAVLVGGFVAKDVGWRWCYWVPCIALGITWVLNLFLLPETIFHRDVDHRDQVAGDTQMNLRSWIRLLRPWPKSVKRHLRLWDLTHCFIMLKYPSVLLTTIYYSYAFGIGTVLFAVTGSASFSAIYGFDTAQVGLAIGVPTTIGSIIGELAAGPVSDLLLLWSNRRHNGESPPETRLHVMWPGLILLPAGVIIEEVCFQHRTHWMGPVMGMGIGCFGLQIISTNIFAYLADRYRPQSAEISTLLNFGRLTFSFTLGFYMLPFAHATSYGTAWIIMAVISVGLYAGIVGRSEVIARLILPVVPAA
ncbi:MFS general substrate transporter [Rhizodiscina lignyota]|uniref:MFS general substrate transporter n=1 Tax=Rhizodiscina lignyota TaxID=1504668 RepID=A0A9P4LZD2_9PEZI|nr:MFS general substrate transporter [Rhizodiscina lignyota]